MGSFASDGLKAVGSHAAMSPFGTFDMAGNVREWCLNLSGSGRYILGGSCKVKQEKLDFLADNPFYTKRFAFYVGRRCRDSTIKDVAK